MSFQRNSIIYYKGGKPYYEHFIIIVLIFKNRMNAFFNLSRHSRQEQESISVLENQEDLNKT